MLVNFFLELKKAEIPVSITELLDLLGALEKRLAFCSMESFYTLARTCLVKDERFFDRYDKVCQRYFKDIDTLDDLIDLLIPEDWLRQEFEKYLSDEEKADIESLGGLENLIEEFKKRLEEQEERHEGGNKWIGTGGTSPFGQQGYNPEGIRVGPEGRNKKAVKVWERRDFKNLDDSVELGTRNIKVALKRLRKFARSGAEEELDLDDTIRSTARNAGFLDLKMVPEKHNSVKVLLFFDIGGSMDPFIRQCEELFSAARSEFKHMEYYYFHNFVYESVWKNNLRRWDNRLMTWDVMHTYTSDYKVIFVGDAAMSPYEILQAGGSVEHWNDEPGIKWFERLTRNFEKVVWLNPTPEQYWAQTQSTEIIHELLEGRMYPLTLAGLDEAMAELVR